MRRLLVALGAVAAVALLALLLWPTDDESVRPAAAPAAPPERETPEPPVVPAAPVARVEAPVRTSSLAFEPPVVPVATGELECNVVMADGARLDDECSLRVLLPTGAELASHGVRVPGAWRFTRLPTGVPLVVAASAKGCLSGLCCDVWLAKDGVLAKRIELVHAPTVTIEVTRGGRPVDTRDLRVELLSGERVVAEGSLADRGYAELRLSTFGEFRARVSSGGETLAAGVPLLVEPTTAAQRRTIDLPDTAAVEIQVVGSSGAPARGVAVYLLGEFPQRPPVWTNAEGVAAFRGVAYGMKLTAVARGDRGTFGSAVVTSDDPTHARIPLLLGQPTTLTGDVVDQGNAALRGATVEVIVRPGTDVVTARSDDAGLFETPALPGGIAEVLVHCEGYLDWRAPQAVEIRPGIGAKIRARMTPRPVGSVLVRVRDESGAPVAGAEVIADPSRARTTTDASGQCRFDRLDAGTQQTFFARRRGFGARAGALPSVRVPRDATASADIVLRAATWEQRDAGSLTATGLVLDQAGEAVFRARVTAGSDVGYTDAAGRFRLTGLTAIAAEPVEVRVAATSPMLEVLRVLLEPDDTGLADLGAVRLRMRPYARISVPNPEGTLTKTRGVVWPSGSTRLFWLSSNHADTLLGSRADAFQPIACVSYDGAWLHLPPADDWLTDGRGEVFVAFATPRGVFTTSSAWTLAPDAAPRVSLPAPPKAGRLSVADAKGRKTISLRQMECTSLFDPRSIHVPTGDAQPPVDPFAQLAPWRSFTISDRDLRDFASEVAPGRWRVSDGDRRDEVIDVGADRTQDPKEKPRPKPTK